jgi:hypothetical protein
MSNTLLMPFIDASESITNGFECGQIWQKISEGESFEKHLIHSENIGQIVKICETFGVSYKLHYSDVEEWSNLTVISVL